MLMIEDYAIKLNLPYTVGIYLAVNAIPDVYLLMALRRPDVWPPGDIALIRALNLL